MSALTPKQAKIVATLGPAARSKDTVRALFDAGANVFRLNFSHGDHQDHALRLQWISELEQELGQAMGVFMDLQGPKFRLGTFRNGKEQLSEGDIFTFDLDQTPGDKTRVCVPHPEIIASAVPGGLVLVDDGKTRFEIETVTDTSFTAKVLNNGVVSDRKGLSLPDSEIKVSALTDKDKEDLQYGLSLGIRSIALSFVQRAEDIAELRALCADDVQIVSKIEKPSALTNLSDIIQASDAVMVARGDLGVELPPEKVPVIQKHITRLSREFGKPVIVATQMLESMISCPLPTRAEASDVATAIYDGVDAVMLSAETAAGDYPIEAVDMMARIIGEIEADELYRNLMQASAGDLENTGTDALSSAACHVAATVGAEVILCYTTTGKTALRAARERPEARIIALTSNEITARKMSLVWGVTVIRLPVTEDMKSMVPMAVEAARTSGAVISGQKAVITAGVPFGNAGSTNILRLVDI